MTLLVTIPIGRFSTKNPMPYFQPPTQNPPLRFSNFGSGIPTRGGCSPLHGSGGPPGRGSEPLKGGGGPSGEGRPQVEVDSQMAKDLQEAVEVDFLLEEAQGCLLVLLSLVPLGTRGTHRGIHRQHPLPLWFLHQRKHCHTQFILLG
jgi:hypothetical protein